MKIATKWAAGSGCLAVVAGLALSATPALAAPPVAATGGAVTVADAGTSAQKGKSGDAAAAARAFVPSTALVNAEAQAVDESTVSVFVAAHPMPTYAMGGSAAQYASFERAIASYWSSVPWSAVAGQWGCTVQSVSVDDSRSAPVVSEATDCGTNLDAATLLNESGVKTKAATLAAALRSQTN